MVQERRESTKVAERERREKERKRGEKDERRLHSALALSHTSVCIGALWSSLPPPLLLMTLS